MSQDKIPRDKNGKPLDRALIVRFWLNSDKKVPIYGTLMNIGPEISLLKSEGAIYEVPNPNIEITIEK